MINVEHLTQTYRSGKGIFDISFSVNEGEVFGYLGPNGAGKTTTLRHLMGFANADKGIATINGLDCRSQADQLQKDIGFLPGEMVFYNRMTGDDFLKFMGNMRRTPSDKRRDALINRFELETTIRIGKMSKGMKQKLGIVTAFMHDPKIYLLDEPSSGLDPLMQKVFMGLIEEEKSRGKTILMSSHILEEVRISCHRAAIIKDGRLVALESVESIEAMSEKGFVVTLRDTLDMQILMTSGLDVTEIGNNRVSVSIDYPFDKFFELLSHLKVTDIEKKQSSLEEVFMKYYSRVGDSND